MPPLHITAFSKCEVDRSSLALFYSANALDWMRAGMVDYAISLGRHFAYPHMIVDGPDLLVRPKLQTDLLVRSKLSTRSALSAEES